MRVIAYYLPQFHAIPENDAWWGKDFTEWVSVRNGRPLYRGHQQPIEPGELGYYNLLDADIKERQAELAREAGVEGFCYWHYWFGGKVDEMILDLIDYGVEDEYDEDEEENSITIYGDPSSFGAIQKHLEENGFEVTGAEFTRIPNDLKDVTPEERETIDKMIEKLEDFDDVQTVYTNMKPEPIED